MQRNKFSLYLILLVLQLSTAFNAYSSGGAPLAAANENSGAAVARKKAPQQRLNAPVTKDAKAIGIRAAFEKNYKNFFTSKPALFQKLVSIACREDAVLDAFKSKDLDQIYKALDALIENSDEYQLPNDIKVTKGEVGAMKLYVSQEMNGRKEKKSANNDTPVAVGGSGQEVSHSNSVETTPQHRSLITGMAAAAAAKARDKQTSESGSKAVTPAASTLIAKTEEALTKSSQTETETLPTVATQPSAETKIIRPVQCEDGVVSAATKSFSTTDAKAAQVESSKTEESAGKSYEDKTALKPAGKRAPQALPRDKDGLLIMGDPSAPVAPQANPYKAQEKQRKLKKATSTVKKADLPTTEPKEPVVVADSGSSNDSSAGSSASTSPAVSGPNSSESSPKGSPNNERTKDNGTTIGESGTKGAAPDSSNLSANLTNRSRDGAHGEDPYRTKWINSIKSFVKIAGPTVALLIGANWIRNTLKNDRKGSPAA